MKVFRGSIWLAVVAITIFCAVFWHFRHQNINKQSWPISSLEKSSLSQLDPPGSVLSVTNPLEPASSELQSNYMDHQKGLISKEDVQNDVLRDENSQVQNFYGRIIDQYGQPVAGADVTGNLEVIGGLSDNAASRIFQTQSDGNGFFQFTRLTGWQLGVTVKRNGFEMGVRGEGFAKALGGQSTPTDRATFTMWRLRGADPLLHTGIESRIPYNGTSAVFDLQTGSMSENGDFRVTLVRSPLTISPGLLHPYNWHLRIELMNGGILPENDPYPYWAPNREYQSVFEFSVSSNDVPWNVAFNGKFYIRNAKGQYGRIKIDLLTDSKRPDTAIEIGVFINPSGSQNLEFDPAKQGR